MRRHLIGGILVVGGQKERHFGGEGSGEGWPVYYFFSFSGGSDDLFTTTNIHHNTEAEVPTIKHINLILLSVKSRIISAYRFAVWFCKTHSVR